MAKKLDPKVAGRLWKQIQLETSHHRVYPREHRGGVIFVGFCDLTLWVGGVSVLGLPGAAIKLIGEEIHFDPKAREAQDGSKRRFPYWLTSSAEARAVFTEALKQDPQVVEMCRQARAKLHESSLTAGE